MGRQLVICLDGTNNRFSHRPTNVIRLLRSLSPNQAEVVSYYDQGVGTFGLKETLFEWQKLPSRICGLAFGWGLKRNVEGAYGFLAEQARSGDEIFVFGFSRGAYAARALAALVHAVGLMPAHQTHLFDYAWAMLVARDRKRDKPDFKLQARFKKTFGKAIKFRFLGLFDTVKSVGWIYDPIVIPYTKRNSAVEIVRHAVAMDERRCFFQQHLYDSDASDKTDVKEVWFSGVHSDIGGGYPVEHARLSLVSFRWMLGEALAAGLRLDPARCRTEMALSRRKKLAGIAEMNDSMTAPWWVAEWLPQRVWNGVDAKRCWHIGAMPPFGKPRPRRIPEGALIHFSVQQRLLSACSYAPPNLPAAYRTVDDHPMVGSLG